MTRSALENGEVVRTISPDDLMFGGDESHYFKVGRSALACIDVALQSAEKPESGIEKILDLPCGHGRVLRHLKAAFPTAEITACDLLRDGVDFCASTLGAVPAYSEEVPAEIPLARDNFDLIWVGSLFTHLRRDAWLDFLETFCSLLRPFGVLVFTTHGREARQRIADRRFTYGIPEWRQTALVYEYDRSGFGYVDYPGNRSRYGVAFSQPAWVFDQVAKVRELRMVHFGEKAWDEHQDCFACVRDSQWQQSGLRVSTSEYLHARLKTAVVAAKESIRRLVKRPN